MLPDRLKLSNCIGCGAMGRAAHCAGGCSEHRLPLVTAGDYDELCAVARLAHSSVAELVPIAQVLTDEAPSERECVVLQRTLRIAAREARDRVGTPDKRDWAAPNRTGWWCAECGNVDKPEPCIDVCIWRDAEWVNAALYSDQYEGCADDLRTARAADALLRRFVAVTPRERHCVDTRRAFGIQARLVVESSAR